MKHLLFSYGFPPSTGGIQNYMYARCRVKPKDLEVVAAKFPGYKEFDARQDFVVHRFNYPWKASTFGPLGRIFQLQRTISTLRRIFKRKQYDVLEVSTIFPGAVAALRLSQRRNFYLVSYAHGDDILHPMRTWYAKPLFRKALKNVDLFISNSRYTKRILINLGISSDKIVIIHPPLDQECFNKHGDVTWLKAKLPPHDLILLTICRLAEKKGIDQVIMLLSHLKKRFPRLLYVVGGEGRDLPRLKMLVRKYNVNDSVVFLGYVPSDKLVNVYAASDVFIMPTREVPNIGEVEGFGIVFLEAGSQGIPVIGPKQGGSADAIIDGISGYLVDPYDIKDIESRIVELLSNPCLRRKLGEAGKKRAFQSADWSPLFNLGITKK